MDHFMSNPLEQQAEMIIGRMLELPEGDRAAAAARKENRSPL
jgi:hypothetical protein